jgi:U6 snRNA-associated Sm-like protein LSm8
MSGSGAGTSNTARTSGLSDWLDKTVSIITSDGRNIVGNLKGFDQTINVILEQSHERIYSEAQGVVQNVLGLYIIRGDNMYVVQGGVFFRFAVVSIFFSLAYCPPAR